jgi:hypothetical protein
MPWPNWRATTRTWLALTLLSCAGCACFHRPPETNQYFCPPEAVYEADGKVSLDKYQVNSACFDSMDRKLKACYDLAH